MLVKFTSRNRITIPKKIVDQLPNVKYFEVELKDGQVLLKPLNARAISLEQIRSKMKKQALNKNAVNNAVRYSRTG